MPYIRRRSPITHRITFEDVALNFTFRCNLACVGCDRASFVKPEHSGPMTLDRIHTFLEEVQSAGITLRVMRIVGGEPTLHPDFLEMTAAVMDYADRVGCVVRLFSNRHTPETRTLVQEVGRRHPILKLMGQRKLKSWVFPPMTRYEYVSPLDAGINCPWPCPNMGSRGKCGSGVDQMGYSLCPTAGPIDAILKLGARATTIKQMLDPAFVRHQAETICSRCGQFMAYQNEDLPPLWYCNGTPVSRTYRDALVASGFPIQDSKP